MTLTEHLEAHRARLESHLDRLLPPESTPPETLHKAIRYAVLAGGKRIRPILCWEAAATVSGTSLPRQPAPPLVAGSPQGEVAGVSPVGIEDLACALEFIHTFSLIHDDLPALDNDDLRRGRPTCHKVFGEAVAILAGDALLALAFETLARMSGPAPEQKVLIISELAAAVGSRRGMIGGQVADLEAEGQAVNAAQVEAIHSAKTGALIRAAVRAGAHFAGASPDDLEHLSRFGERLGLAFQVVDDLLDLESSPEQLGKSTGKDSARRKATYPAVLGAERSRTVAHELIDEAVAELAPLGARARRLEEIARYLLARTR